MHLSVEYTHTCDHVKYRGCNSREGRRASPRLLLSVPVMVVGPTSLLRVTLLLFVSPLAAYVPCSNSASRGVHGTAITCLSSQTCPTLLHRATGRQNSAQHSSQPLASARCSDIRMMDDNEEEPLAGFGLRSLFRTSLFVTLWWALWSLYDFYLSPFSPWPELAILACATLYSFREDLKQREKREDGSSTSANTSLRASVSDLPSSSLRPSAKAPWPCTSDGCMTEDVSEVSLREESRSSSQGR